MFLFNQSKKNILKVLNHHKIVNHGYFLVNFVIKFDLDVFWSNSPVATFPWLVFLKFTPVQF